MAILKPDKTTTLTNGLVVNEYLLTEHNPNKISMPAKRTANQPLIGVTLHNTDWLNVFAETTPAEQYVRATYNGNMGDTRVHYYVDDKCAWKTLDDVYTGWHAATGGQGQGNCNTISIECIMRNQTDAVSAMSMENAARLIAAIFIQYGWTVDKNLYTHNYWTNYKDTGALSADLDAQSLKKCTSAAANPNGKYCPVFILPQWEKFKTLIKKYMGITAPVTPPEPPKTEPTSPTVEIKENAAVAFKDESKTYYPGSSEIPQWVKSDFYHTVTQTSIDSKTVLKGGVPCVLLGKKINKKTGKEEAGINTWVSIQELNIVSESDLGKTKE